jgi:hypothetical protein
MSTLLVKLEVYYVEDVMLGLVLFQDDEILLEKGSKIYS